MTEISRKQIGKNDHGFSHIAYNKDTNEPVLGLKKSSYGNDYSYQIHPDFVAAHGDVMHLHDKNTSGSYSKSHDIDNIATRLHDNAYAQHYNPQKRSTYKYSHKQEHENGQTTHVYDFHDPDGDKVLSAHFDSPPERIANTSTTKKIENLNNQKYRTDHYDAAKVKYSNNNPANLLNMVSHMHENKDKDGPRFVGHETSQAAHKSFKTKLQAPDAINAYVDHLKSTLSDDHEVLAKSNTHAMIKDGKMSHMITHVDGHLHHATIGNKYQNTSTNSQIIEQLI